MSKGREEKEEETVHALMQPDTMMMPDRGDWPKAIRSIRLAGRSRLMAVDGDGAGISKRFYIFPAPNAVEPACL